MNRSARTSLTLACFVAVIFSGSPHLGHATSTETSPNTPSGTFSWKLGSWTLGVPTVSDTAYIFAGTVEVDGSVSVGRLRFSNGSLVGATDSASDSLFLEGTGIDSRWTGGSLSSLTLVVNSAAGLEIEHTGTASLSAALLDIRGDAYWNDGNINLNSSSTIDISGSFFDLGAGTRSISGSGSGSITIQSTGEFVKGSAGTTSLNRPVFNDGAIQVGSGVLELAGGGANADGGGILVTNSGLLKFTGDYTIANAADLEVGNSEDENELDGTHFFFLPDSEDPVEFGYELAGGTLDLGSAEGGTLNVALRQTGGTLAGTHIIGAEYVLEGGDLNSSGTTTVASGGALIFANPFNNDFDGRTIDILDGGGVDWVNGNLRSGDNGAINNSGFFYDGLGSEGDIRVANNAFGGSAWSFNNLADGEYVKDSPGTTRFDVAFNNQGEVTVDAGTLSFAGGGTNSPVGTIDADLGTLVIFKAGNFTVDDAANLTGLGQFEIEGGTLTLSGTVNAPNFEIEGGTLAGTHTFANGATWLGGDLNSIGTTTNASGSTFNLSNSAQNDFDDRTIENQSGGTTNWTDGDLRSGGGGLFNNYGVFNDSAAGSGEFETVNNAYGGTALIFTNAASGTYNKTGLGTTRFDVNFNNDGTVNVDAGNLTLSGGGSASASGEFDVDSGATLQFGSNYSVADATKLTGNGDFNLSGGTLTLDGVVGVADFMITGGTLAGTHSFTNGATWTGGNLNSVGTTTNASGSIFNLSHPSQNDFDNRTIENQTGGIVNWTDGDLRSGGGGLFNNFGTFNDKSTSFGFWVASNAYGGAAWSFQNKSGGDYIKDSLGNTRFEVSFTNDGNLDINSGALYFAQGGTNSASGTIDVEFGSALLFSGGNFLIADAAQLTGTGQFKLIGGSVTLDGVLNVPDFQIIGSTIKGTHTLAGGADWTGGNFNSAGTTTNASGSIFNLRNSGQNDFDGRTINNQSGGIVNWTDGDLRSGGGGLFYNYGTFNDSAAGSGELETVNNAFGGTALVFTNKASGTYNKTGLGTARFDVNFNNDGTVNVDAGTLVLNGEGSASASGVFDVDAGATLQFDSDYSVADAAGLTGGADLVADAICEPGDGRWRRGDLD